MPLSTTTIQSLAQNVSVVLSHVMTEPAIGRMRYRIQVIWGESPEHHGCAYLILASNHAHIVPVNDPMSARTVLVCDPVGRRAIRVTAHGDREDTIGQVDAFGDGVCVVAVESAPCAPDGLLPKSVRAACDEEMCRLLNTRAQHWCARDRVRRFFLQFDAWTRPDLYLLLLDDERQSALGVEARSLFVCGIPSAYHESVRVVNRVVGTLEGVARHRASTVRVFLEQGSTLAANSSCEVEEDRVLDLAAHQEAIFDAYARPDADGKPPACLIELFAKFAAGHLRFLRAPASHGECDLTSVLNCEPEGAVFLCWAEFALVASDLGGPRSVYWQDLAIVFAALQEVMMHTYGPAVSPHTAERIGRFAFSKARKLRLQEVLDVVQYYRQNYSHPKALACRMAVNAVWALY